MMVRMVKMRIRGVEIDRRALKETFGYPGMLIVQDTTDQGLRRPCKVARLMQGDGIRSELKDVHIVWVNDGRMTLSGFERQQNEAGIAVDYAQSWLCILDNTPTDYGSAPSRKISPKPVTSRIRRPTRPRSRPVVAHPHPRQRTARQQIFCYGSGRKCPGPPRVKPPARPPEFSYLTCPVGHYRPLRIIFLEKFISLYEG
jgi:hypothetical protein